MMRLLFGTILIVVAIIAWTIAQSKKEQLGPEKYYWAGSVVMAFLGLFLFISTSFVIVGPDQVGHLTRV